MGKSLVQSKTFWVGVLTIVGGIATAIAGQLEAGGGLTLVGVANILLRLVTKERITEILPRLAILLALAGSSMSLAGEGDFMLVDDRPAFASQLPAATPTASYKQAYDRAMASGRPLVVMVGAAWCPPCQRAKALIAKTPNGGVEYALVDYDLEKSTAKKIMDGRRGIPHLAVWTRSGAVWSVKHYTGVQSAEFYRRVFRNVGRNKLRAVPAESLKRFVLMKRAGASKTNRVSTWQRPQPLRAGTARSLFQPTTTSVQRRRLMVKVSSLESEGRQRCGASG